MAKMVLDLQQACLDEKVSCYYLLLKAYAIAEKLSIKDMAEFCSNEMSGYLGVEDPYIPSYRKTVLNVEAFDPNLGSWVPVHFPAQHPIRRRNIIESIAEIERFEKTKGDILEIRPTAEIQRLVHKTTNMSEPMNIRQVMSIAQLVAVTQIVRKFVLDWALKLEKQGILGEGLVFSDEEQGRVKDVPSIQIIQNWNMSGANLFNSSINPSNTINNGFDFEKISKLMEDISQKLVDLALPDNQETELKSAITEIRDLVAKKDETGIRKVLRKIENICQSIPGNVIAALICSQIGQILG